MNQAVENFIERCDKGDLVFCDVTGNIYETPVKHLDADRHSVEAMVRRCLTLTEEYLSRNVETGEWETGSKRRRSVLDIWRHIRYYYPEITIYQVMNAMFNIQEELVSTVCCTINRRVFRLASHCIDIPFMYKEASDEFGISFYEWETVT